MGYSAEFCVVCETENHLAKFDNYSVTLPENKTGPWFSIIIIIVCIFAAISICAGAYCLHKYLTDKSNIKWKRKYMESKLEKIAAAPKRSRRQTVMIKKNTDFSDLT